MKQADGLTPRFESIIVVTDRVNLDKQIRDNIRAFCNNKSIVQWADDSEALKTALSGGKKIIVSTICKFPFILQTLGKELAERQFAVIIDEAHSSQSGSMQSALNRVLSGYGHKDVNLEDNEDGLNELLEYVVAGRMMAKNTNFYAFTLPQEQDTGDVRHPLYECKRGNGAQGFPYLFDAPGYRGGFHHGCIGALYDLRQLLQDH